MPDSKKDKERKIQLFINELDKSNGGKAVTLRNQVNAMDPEVKSKRGMTDEEGYESFWHDFYALGYHVGDKPNHTSHDVGCCCCCT